MTEASNMIRIAVAQVAPRIGAISANADLVREWRTKAADAGADAVVFSELFISGYPPEDLVRKPAYAEECRAAVELLARDTQEPGPMVIVGAPWATPDGVFNAVACLDGGWILRVAYKHVLPNYGVFDEPRRYRPGRSTPPLIPCGGASLGVMVCEDMWVPGVGERLAGQGADILIAPHGSPYRQSADEERLAAARSRAIATKRPILFVNQLCGQDEIVFDGGPFVLDVDGRVGARGAKWVEGLHVFEFSRGDVGWEPTAGPQAEWPVGEASDYAALVRATRDYVTGNGFSDVVVGLSGGIDSALVAAIAVDAFGPERVRCVLMPSRFTSPESNADALDCATLLGVATDTAPIEGAVAALQDALAPLFAGRAEDVTEENIQSRVRGTILMAISNKFGSMVLTTGNKSEMAVGYATLYGDMNGGFNPLKDVYKTHVYRLARWRNGTRPDGALGPDDRVIPESILTKAPTAELREGQTDQDSLPDYAILDRILDGLVERDRSAAELADEGFDPELVGRIEHLLYVSEYKRRQSAPGPKITRKAFGRDRRYPITNAWRSPAPVGGPAHANDEDGEPASVGAAPEGAQE